MLVLNLRGKDYIIYTKEEADSKGIQYKYWLDAEKEGEYVLSDNDFVVPVIKIKDYMDYKGRVRRWYKFPLMDIFGLPRAKFEWNLDRLLHGGYNNFKIPKTDKPSDVVYTFLRTYLYQLIYEGKVDYSLLTKIITRGKSNAPWISKNLLRKGRIRSMLDKEVEAFFKKYNITQETVVQIYEKARQIAEEKGNSKDLISIADRYAEFLNMKEQNKKSLPPMEYTEKSLDEVINKSKNNLIEEAEILDETEETR